MWELAGKIFAMSSEQRSTADAKTLLPWFRHRSSLFENLEDDVLLDVIKNATLLKMKKDFVIVQQGEVGHCFYIIFKGSVSVYARREDESADYTQPQDYAVPVRGLKERIALFGAELGNLGEGSSFGEMALTGAKKERNATLIADEPTELVIIDQVLYERSFKVYDHEWQDKATFVNTCPLFEAWPATFKGFLIENLKASKYVYGNRVVKQGSACERIIFIAKGWAKLLIDPRLCLEQQRALAPKGSPCKVKNEKRQLSEDETPIIDVSDPLQTMNVIQRRRHRLEHGFVAMETRLRRRDVHVTTIGPNDIIGDVEMILDLPTYCASAECVESLQVYELDKSSFHHLIVRRNPETLFNLTQVVIVKLRFRHAQFAHIPLFEVLLERATRAPERDKHALKRWQSIAGSNGPNTSQKKTSTAVQLVKPLGYASTEGKVTGQKTASDTKANESKLPEKKETTKNKFTAMELRASKKKMPAQGNISDTKAEEIKRPEKEERFTTVESRAPTNTMQAQDKLISDKKTKDKKRSEKKETTQDKFTSVELKALQKKIEAQQKIISHRKVEEKKRPEKKEPAKNHFAAMELGALKRKMQAEGKMFADKKAEEEKKHLQRRESTKNRLAAAELRALKKTMQAKETVISDRRAEDRKRPEKKDTSKNKHLQKNQVEGDKEAKDKKRSEKKEPMKKQFTAAEFRTLKKKMHSKGKIIGGSSTGR